MNRERAEAIDRLGDTLYENFAEPYARVFGKAEALSFYALMGDDIRNFWRGLAKQIIDHSEHWLPNEGSACVLDDEERERLALAPRVL